MIYELKPCPFCGQTGVGVHTDRYLAAHDYVPYAFVVCPHCSAQGPIVQRGEMTEGECKVLAMRAWERRVKA